MLLHILYVLAFTIVAFFAVGNLIRNLLTLGLESTRPSSSRKPSWQRQMSRPPHPEFLDDQGNLIEEPLLVMKSMTVEDAREQLDALYRSSPGGESNNSSPDELK